MSLAKTPRKRKNKEDFYKLKLITSKSKEEFLKEYEKYDEQSARDFYLHVLFELEKSVKVGNVDNLKCLSSAIDNFSSLENKTSVKNFFDDSRNPFKSTNLIILTCKHDQVEVLKYLFQYDKIVTKLSIQAGKNISPKDEDETCHNAFYYAIRSGNLQLLKILRNWTENFFSDHKYELDEILSKSCEELKLKNVPLTDQMEILVEDIMIDLRFYTNTFRLNENIISDLDNINKRIELVLENISLLKSEKPDTEVDEKFLFVVKFIAQNIHILKRLLKSTYDRLPWEELEFCFICFVSSHTKFQEINFFYHAALDKRKLLHYLQIFASRLEEVKRSIKGININRLAVLPNLNRETIVREILNRNPDFGELYKNYQQIRDIHSLEKINNCINLAVTVDPGEKEGQIVIIRVLQLMGEYLKNTLESPKLSNATSELLLLSLSRSTRKVVTDLRNSLSHASSLFKRTEIQEHSDIKFFTGVQSDIKKIGNAIIDILYDNKIKVIRRLLKKIIDSEDFNEIKEVIKVLKNCEAKEMNSDNFKMVDHDEPKKFKKCGVKERNSDYFKVMEHNKLNSKMKNPEATQMNSDYFKTMEHDKLKKLIKELYDNIEGKTQEEEELFTKINHKISFSKCNFNNIQHHYIVGLLSIKALQTLFIYNKINHNIIRGLKFSANETLKNITSPIESHSLKEIAELSKKLFYCVKSRKYHENLDNINILFCKIFYITEFQASDIKWIEEFRGKLNEERSFISALAQKKNDEINTQLTLKTTELRSVLKKLFNSEEIEKVCSYKTDRKSQAVVEMILLDIMSILSISDYYLVNNLFFLDDHYPLLTGKSLRNHLAHDNTILDILSTNPCISVAFNAKKVTEEDLLRNKKKIKNFVADDPVRLREKHYQNLKVIAYQRRMYSALEEGKLEIVKDCLKNGADINGRSNNTWTVLHFAAKGSNLEVIKFILEQNVQVNITDQDGQNPLHIAVTYGNISVVDYFIKKTSLFVDDVDYNLRTPLHLAAQKGHCDIVDLLLENNADFASKDLLGMLPLHYAIRNNHFDIAKILLGKDVNVDISETMGGFTPLHEAAEFGTLEIVNFLLQNGANVNAKSDRNYTPLHAAAFNGHLNVVNVLILKNADINATVIDGCTPLHYALEKGYEEIANVLLSHGARVNVSDKAFNNTPLHYAAKNGHENSVKALLKCGADATVTTVTGSTPLHFAAHSGYLQIVSVLLEHGVNIQVKDNKNVTPLHYAVQNGQTDIAAFLIKNNAKVDAIDDEGFTPLYIATLKGYKDITNLLLKNGACVNVSDLKGNTIMHAAAMKGCKDIIDVLIAYKAKVNARNNDGMTPLHVASINDCEDTIISLLENGAEINAKDSFGLVPLHAAVTAGHKNIVELLIKNKANINLKNDFGHTSIHLAVEAGHKEIVELLIANGIDVNGEYTDKSFTPLFTAVKYNHKEIVKVLIKNGAIANDKTDGPLSLAIAAGYRDIVEILIKNKAKIDNVDSENNTLLHIAANRGEKEIVKTLIKMGADVNVKTINNVTPLFLAAHDGHEEVVEFLIVNGAILNVVSDEGLTPLHAAAANGHSSAFKVLLQYGANINIKDGKNRTCLELAVLRGHLPVIKLLFQSKKIDLNAKGKDDWTVLHMAAQGSNLEIVRYLVSEGADVNCKNASGSKPIHIAAREGFKDAVEYFLSIGCYVNDLGAANQTLLHYAAMKHKLELVKYLIDQGAHVNIKDANGSSALHIAAIFGSRDTIEVLLKNGAAYNAVDNFSKKALDVATKKDVSEYLMSTKKYFEAVKSNNVSEVKKYIKTGVIVDVKNTDGMTPLHFAAWKGHEELLNILLQNNANPNTVGNKGVTPLHYAVKFSHLKVVEVLLSHGAIFNAVSENGKTPIDFSEDESIAKLFKIVTDSFKFVKNGSDKVINNLNKIKDIDTIKAVMNACNSEHETLIVVAIRYNFQKVEELKNISQNDVSNRKNVALMIADQGDYQRALCIFNDLYEERKSILGPNNPGTLEMERDIATILYKQGKYSEALCKLERIYQEQKEILGFRNKDTLYTRSIIAIILYRQERSEEAFEIYEEVYHNQKETLGSNHPDTLDTEFHMALVLNALGRYEEALNINKKIYKERKKKLGADHPITVRVQNNIAMVLCSQGNYEQSLEIYKEVLEKKKLILGLYHTDTLRTLQHIASVLVRQKNNCEALKAYREVFDIQKTVLGPDNPETLNTQYHLANIFFTQGKFANALKVYTECFEHIKAVFGPNHAIVSDISQKLEIIKFRFELEGNESAEILLHMQADMKTAVKNGDISTVLRLVKDGVDINEKDDCGITVLHYAVSLGQIDIVNVLLQNGADVFQVTNKCNTSLHLAASKNNREIVEILLQHVPRNKLSAFINARTNSGNTTALHVAAKNDSLDIIKTLLKYGAIYDIENNEGKKPLNLTANQSVKSLLKLIEESFENTHKGNSEVTKRLKTLNKDEFWAVLNTRNHKGNTLLQVAIARKHLEIADCRLRTPKSIVMSKIAIMYSKQFFEFMKSDTFILTARQELIAEEIAKDFVTYCRLFYSDDFSSLGQVELFEEVEVVLFEYEINFLRRNGMLNQFYFPEKNDKNIVDESDYIIKLPNPLMVGGTLRTATTITFHFDFSKFQNTC